MKHGENVKAMILDAGLELWKSGGAASVTARAIALAIGKSHANVHYHFGYSMENLRDAVAQHAVSVKCIPVILQLIAADHRAARAMAKGELARLRRLM